MRNLFKFTLIISMLAYCGHIYADSPAKVEKSESASYTTDQVTRHSKRNSENDFTDAKIVYHFLHDTNLQWVDYCTRFKHKHRDTKVFEFDTFSDYVDVSSYPDYALLKFYGAEIPIPLVKFKHFKFISKPEDGDYLFMLENDSLHITVFRNPNWEVKLASNQSDLSRNSEPAGIDKLFDKDYSTLELYKIAENTQLADIKCEIEHRRSDARNMYLWNGKNRPKSVFSNIVFKSKYHLHGYTELYEPEENMTMLMSSFMTETSNIGFITTSKKSEQKYFALHNLFIDQIPVKPKPQPAWLELLNVEDKNEIPNQDTVESIKLQLKAYGLKTWYDRPPLEPK